jgi:hypothetical protein
MSELEALIDMLDEELEEGRNNIATDPKQHKLNRILLTLAQEIQALKSAQEVKE